MHLFLESYFFEKLSPTDPVIWTINKSQYASMLQNRVVPALQLPQCLGRTLLMRNKATPHITICVKDVLKTHCTGEKNHKHRLASPIPRL